MSGIDIVTRMVLPSMAFFGVLGAAFGLGLALTARYFHSPLDPRISRILEALPHAHCGACGFAGCQAYAEAVVMRPEISPNLCAPGGQRCAQVIAAITGKSAQQGGVLAQRVTNLPGSGTETKSIEGGQIKKPRRVPLAASEVCTGCSECVQLCPTAAITIVEGKAAFDLSKCIGCGICAKRCPVSAVTVVDC